VGETADSIVGALRRLSKYPLPGHVRGELREFRLPLWLPQTDPGTMATRCD